MNAEGEIGMPEKKSEIKSNIQGLSQLFSSWGYVWCLLTLGVFLCNLFLFTLHSPTGDKEINEKLFPFSTTLLKPLREIRWWILDEISDDLETHELAIIEPWVTISITFHSIIMINNSQQFFPSFSEIEVHNSYISKELKLLWKWFYSFQCGS